MKERPSPRPRPPSRPVRVVVEPALHDDPDARERALRAIKALLEDESGEETGAGR